jgi:hypothetical protein
MHPGCQAATRVIMKKHLINTDLCKAMRAEDVAWVVIGWIAGEPWQYLGWITRVREGSRTYFEAFAIPEDYEVSYYNDTPPEGIPVVNADRCGSAVRALVQYWEAK